MAAMSIFASIDVGFYFPPPASPTTPLAIDPISWVYATDLAGEPVTGYAPWNPVALWGTTDDTRLISLVLSSLFADRRAESTDAIPDGTDDRRGWWADMDVTDEGQIRIGSRLWLLTRSPVNDDTTARAEDYVREALAWMIEDHIISSIDIETEIQHPPSTAPGDGLGYRVAISITLTRPDGTGVQMRWPDLWTPWEAA